MKNLPVVPLLLLLVFYLFFGLGNYGLFDNNEGLYAEIAREMLETRDFIIPHLNGLPYLEKPPLLYWLVAGMYALVGPTEIAARLVPALAAACVILSLLWFGKKTGRKNIGLWSALILGSSIGFLCVARTLLFDMVLCAFLSWSLVHFYFYLSRGTQKNIRWSYAFLGLAVMTKGLIALVLFGLIAVIYSCAVSGPRLKPLVRVMFEPGAVALFLVISVPWHVLAALEEQGFLWFYFVNEHLLRFLDLRQPHDYRVGPWHFYIPRLLFALFPWMPLLPLFAFRTSERSQPDALNERLFLRLWWLVPFIFFSLCAAKTNYYIIVALPPVAYLLARKIDQVFREGLERKMLLLIGSVPAVFAAVLAFLIQRREQSENIARFFSDLQAASVCAGLFFLLAIGAFVLFSARRHALSLYLIALSCAPLLFLLLHTIETNELHHSSRELARMVRSSDNRPVFLYRDFEEISALPFYLGKPVSLIDSASSDLAYGIMQAGVSDRFVPAGHLIEDSLSGQKVYVVVLKKRLEEFSPIAAAARLRPVVDIGRTVLFANGNPEFQPWAFNLPGSFLSTIGSLIGLERPAFAAPYAVD